MRESQQYNKNRDRSSGALIEEIFSQKNHGQNSHQQISNLSKRNILSQDIKKPMQDRSDLDMMMN